VRRSSRCHKLYVAATVASSEVATLSMRTVEGGAHAVIWGISLPSLLPWEHMTIERSSQLPARRCRLSMSTLCRLPPNCEKMWRRKDEWVTTAMHFSGRWLSHCRKCKPRSQQCSSVSRAFSV
jgi:hypothetical protein